MTPDTPVLQSCTLALAAVAALGLGWLGGMAAHPVMKPVQGSDWRERYRTAAAEVTDPGEDFGGSYGYGYGYGWGAGLVHAGAERLADVPLAEAPPADWSDGTEPALVAGPEPDLAQLDRADPPAAQREGVATVADALARTAGIGEPGAGQNAEPAPDAVAADPAGAEGGDVAASEGAASAP